MRNLKNRLAKLEGGKSEPLDVYIRKPGLPEPVLACRLLGGKRSIPLF